MAKAETTQVRRLVEQVEGEGLDRIYWELSRTQGMTPGGSPFRASDSSGTPINSIFLKEQA